MEVEERGGGNLDKDGNGYSQFGTNLEGQSTDADLLAESHDEVLMIENAGYAGDRHDVGCRGGIGEEEEGSDAGKAGDVGGELESGKGRTCPKSLFGACRGSPLPA